ncbi:MAG: hypothetical protein K2Q45_02455 [Nitrosomonas sp.]|nr:hypothetical protein [Nitrosomonas sp.]
MKMKQRVSGQVFQSKGSGKIGIVSKTHRVLAGLLGSLAAAIKRRRSRIQRHEKRRLQGLVAIVAATKRTPTNKSIAGAARTQALLDLGRFESALRAAQSASKNAATRAFGGQDGIRKKVRLAFFAELRLVARVATANESIVFGRKLEHDFFFLWQKKN